MPEIHVPQQLNDNTLSDDDKAQKIEELRKIIEGKLPQNSQHFRFQSAWLIEYSSVNIIHQSQYPRGLWTFKYDLQLRKHKKLSMTNRKNQSNIVCVNLSQDELHYHNKEIINIALQIELCNLFA